MWQKFAETREKLRFEHQKTLSIDIWSWLFNLYTKVLRIGLHLWFRKIPFDCQDSHKSKLIVQSNLVFKITLALICTSSSPICQVWWDEKSLSSRHLAALASCRILVNYTCEINRVVQYYFLYFIIFVIFRNLLCIFNF